MTVTARPNILLITTDQQRFDTIQAAGNRCIFTPHLNWLVDSGVHFTNAYSDCPICMPARATIMTGRYGYSMGLTGNSGAVQPIRPELSLPGLLTRAGYQTRAEGKMHFHPNRCSYGFEHMEILEDYYRHMAAHPEKGVPMDHGVGQNEIPLVISTVSETNSLTHWTVDRSIEFLETRDPTRPFFLWTSFAKPHSPFDPCLNYWEMYRNAETPEPVRGDWSATPEDVPEGFRRPTAEASLAWRYSEAQQRDIRRAYYACITQIDYNLGLLFARMRELGLLGNTLIVFTADHGDMLDDHHLSAKSVPFEGSAHIPMIVRPPQPDWVYDEPRRGTKSEALVCLADVLPTCLAAAGVEVPHKAHIDGTDMLAAAAGQGARSTLFGESGTFHFVREGDYKYAYETWGGAEMLFNLREDPYERHELVRSGGHAAQRDALRAKLVARLAASGHAALHDGQLVPPDPAKRPPTRTNVWPGFHSRSVPNEVAH